MRGKRTKDEYATHRLREEKSMTQKQFQDLLERAETLTNLYLK
jgi:hypothetical protein